MNECRNIHLVHQELHVTIGKSPVEPAAVAAEHFICCGHNIGGSAGDSAGCKSAPLEPNAYFRPVVVVVPEVKSLLLQKAAVVAWVDERWWRGRIVHDRFRKQQSRRRAIVRADEARRYANRPHDRRWSLSPGQILTD